MDAKLKTLKVADLKAVLAKAQVQAPAKATKADLIGRIVESQAALDAYAQLYEGASKPVEEVPEAIPTSDTVEIVTEAAPPAEPAAPVDPELEARKKRAERFGIPLVEPKTKPARKERQPKAAPSAEDTKKLNERAERFGLKRSAPAETVDPEEAERRRKRAERFGTQPTV